ncbi:irregular chiasm C-roughest protein-like isoform X3 [Macrosteles quadrilineatus]|uniref:irregular chiasm C-roughest protein-like isoform X3 n=1 Tax=Macrosteles quadrilineatus TaxID=74068 RepID=UPI0023E2991D|nr:irregular chiasm C-roughest protein-like isoform X3 [Macrosteles quadrilineatus]
MLLRWVVALLAWAGRGSSLREQKFAMEPQDQTAVVGSRVTLPCRVINKSGLLQWTKDGFGLGTHRNLSGFDRYMMIGSDEEGDYSLDIYPAMLDDDASYQCQVGTGPNGETAVRSRIAHLSVLTPPEPPRIVQTDYLLTTEDREIELECISAAGKPAAEITWIDGLGNVLTDGIEYMVEALPDGRRFTARSILKLTPKKEHHNTTFTCQAQNTADRTYRSAKLRLEVKYAPKVTVSVVGSMTRLVEGQDVRLLCSADANPPNVTYRWFINDQLVLGDPTTELVMSNISRKNHDSIVKCEVHNAVGKSEESEALDISYGPRFRTKPRSMQADLGASVTLICDVDGNPPPDIVWIHEDSDRRGNVLTFTWEQVVSTSSNLTITVTHESAGRYFCRATVPGFPDIGAEATIYMKGPPTIISHRTQFGIPGDNVRLECSAFSIPTPQKVVWSFKGEDVGSDQDYSVLEDPLTEGIKSTLIIRESRLEHFGVYNCTVSNPYGSDVVEITLKAQKSFPLLLILTGVLGGVVVIVAVTMVVILCQRKVKKPQADNLDPEKQCKESDRSSNISDMKLELRTGSSVSNVHCELDYSGGHESETGSESVVTRIGLPLAGPVPLDHRYSQRFSSTEFPDPVFPPKTDGQNNNGYVPYVDYARDYNPPPPPTSGAPTIQPANGGVGVDPRYSAAYGNPYLRNAVSPQLPPPTGPPLAPPPPPYSAVRNGAAPQVSRLPASPTSQYITSQQATIKRGTLATHV